MRTLLYFRIIIPLVFFILGCGQHIHEVIISSPPGADIYWGKTKSEIVKTNRQTDSSRSIPGDKWESWCYQVIKPGYHPSEIVCKPDGETYRNITINLIRKKTHITSEPPGAEIYWGSSKEDITKTNYLTPWTEDRVYIEANYKDWYFQVRKKGYKDSEIFFIPESKHDRKIDFLLVPIE